MPILNSAEAEGGDANKREFSGTDKPGQCAGSIQDIAEAWA